MRRFPIAILTMALPLAATDAVRTEDGLLAGASGRSPEVRVYKGIPYASAPEGPLRWKAPQPPAPWKGVRQAVQFSPMCYQLPYAENSIYYSPAQPMSEDCLYLNVWTAAKSAAEGRPVMVWIHGGALTRGTGSTPTYDGENLAKKGVVLVTLNYRLNVLGFFAHPGLTKESDRSSSGNYAFLDQIAALRWVKRNIAAFGGDANRVTIFGESAGSWSVNYLMATPLAKGLFHRAIGQSGGAFAPMKSRAEMEREGENFGAAAGAESLDALRAKPAEELVKASGMEAFRPNVDGWMLAEDVYSIFAKGKHNDVPLIAGSNADEATALSPWPAGGTRETFVRNIQRFAGPAAEVVLKLYPAVTDAEAKASHYASYRDLVFTWQMRTWVRLATENGKSPAFHYFFSRVPPGANSETLGSYHAAEIAYVFHNLGMSKRPYQDVDRRLSETMSSYWVNFAEKGDPNGDGLPKWPAYRTASDETIEFGDAVTSRTELRKVPLDFLDHYYRVVRGLAGR